jgi:hypothetical protein
MDAGAVDSGSDAGRDAGHDAGHTRFDAGYDAGFTFVPVDQWCNWQRYAQCWRDYRCGRIDETLIDNCVARKLPNCDPLGYAYSVGAGKLAFDSVQAARCLNAYTLGCEETPSECASVLHGLTPSDGGCITPEDCDPDAGYCDPYDDSCPHHCRPWARLGDDCSPYFTPRCGPGTGCDSSEDDAGIFRDHCILPLDAGMPCQYSEACGPNALCSSGRCIKQFAGEGEHCQTVPGLPTCEKEFVCRLNGDGGTCVRRAGLGGQCTCDVDQSTQYCRNWGSQEFSSQGCLLSLRCTSLVGTGTCERHLGIGAPCSALLSTGGVVSDCAEGLWCPPQTSRCALLPGDGGNCSFDVGGSQGECAPGQYCDYFDDACKPKHETGELCNGSDQECLSNSCAFRNLPDANFEFRCIRCAQMVDGG